VQLRVLNVKAGQKDNSDLFRKAELRRWFCQDVKRADIFLAGAGFGEMFRHAWWAKASYTLALDTNVRKVEDLRFHFPEMDARIADFQTFREWPERRCFRIADFDAFGELYPGILHFLDDAPWNVPLDIIVGDSKVLAFKRNGHVSPPTDARPKGDLFHGGKASGFVYGTFRVAMVGADYHETGTRNYKKILYEQ
jgi:hypothetical protein